MRFPSEAIEEIASSVSRGKLNVKKPQVSYNGGCSSVAERATVARITGVRFSPSALSIAKDGKAIASPPLNKKRGKMTELSFSTNKNSGEFS